MVKIIFFIALIALVYAEYDHKFEPAPIGHDGKVVDTHEVAYVKKLHAKAHDEALEKLHHAGAFEHESYEKYPHLRSADNPGNFYNVHGDFELIDGKYIPKTKEVYFAAEDHFKKFDEIKEGWHH